MTNRYPTITNERIAAVLRNQDHMIAQHGQCIVGVFPAVGDPEPSTGFYYTIGNAERGLPELLMIGNFPQRLAMPVLNQIGEIMRDKGVAPDEGLIDLGWTVPFKLRLAGEAARTDYTLQAARRVNGAPYAVMQVMCCDKEGKFPGDEGCHPQFDVARP